MGQDAQADELREKLEGYRVTKALMERAAQDALFMHCLPAHRGEEVTDEVMDGPAERRVRRGREPAARPEGALAAVARRRALVSAHLGRAPRIRTGSLTLRA
jgi:hypothetical protein